MITSTLRKLSIKVEDDEMSSEVISSNFVLMESSRPVSSATAILQSLCLIAVLMILLVTRHSHH